MVLAATCAQLSALIADVPDDDLTASSSHGSGALDPPRSRLHTQHAAGVGAGAWSAQYITANEYIQVSIFTFDYCL